MGTVTMTIAVVVWWFIGPLGSDGFGPIGPFETETECRETREWLAREGWNVSPCYRTLREPR